MTDQELIAELREQLRNPELLRDTTRDYQEPSESFKTLIEWQRNRFAAAKTYAELCDASKEAKRMRDEWERESGSIWEVNLRRVLPKLGESES